MESLGIWKTIKIGFWLGIGFIVPQLIVLYSGTALTMLAMPLMMEASLSTDEDGFMSGVMDRMDRKDQIIIKGFRETKSGNQLLILGSIENQGDKKTSSIQLEAELLNAEGEFVYECSEYISKDMQPGDVENFQIKCGCGDNSVPDYASVNVRVISANSY